MKLSFTQMRWRRSFEGVDTVTLHLDEVEYLMGAVEGELTIVRRESVDGRLVEEVVYSELLAREATMG